MPGIVEVFKARIRELGITHQTVDALAGLPDGYVSKIMCGMKNPGPIAIQALCGALAIGFIPVVDLDQQARVRDRWVQRKRPLCNVDPSAEVRRPTGALLVEDSAQMLCEERRGFRMPTEREQISIRLERELREKLQRAADEDQRPLAGMIRKILHDFTKPAQAAA